MKLNLNLIINKALAKVTNHYTYQMSLKIFLVNINLCACPPDSMTSFTRYSNIHLHIIYNTKHCDWCKISKCCDILYTLT